MQRARKKYNLKEKIYKKKFSRSFKPKFTSMLSETPARCEFVIYYIANTGTASIYNANTASYNSIATELSVSYTWQTISPDYLRYKITGISLRATPVAGDVDLGYGVTNYPINIAFYPNLISTNVVNSEVLSKDDSFRIEPFVTRPQTKYYKFPDKYFESGGTGFGVWSPVSAIASQVGQLSVGYNVPIVNFGSNKLLYMVRVCIYVSFGNRRV